MTIIAKFRAKSMNPAPAMPAIRTVKNRHVYIALVGIWVLLAGTSPSVLAQDTVITVRVTYVAGQNVYLDVGRDQGVMPGDTLRLYREGALVGEMTVVSSIADRSVTTFAGEPFPVTRGGTFQLRATVLPPEESAVPDPENPVEPQPEPEVLVEQQPEPDGAAPSRERARVRRRAGPKVSGRVMLSLNALQSQTSWAGVASGSVKRTFLTPSMNLQLNVRDLPSGMRFRTRLRTDYRYTTSRSIEPTLSVRAYEVLVEKDFDQFAVQAGRFSNRYASYGGYWDGLLVHYGNRRSGVGTALGFMPDRSNEGFTSEMPRYGGFAHFEVGDRSGLRYGANLSFNEIRPTNDLLNHRFAGLSHDLRWQTLALRNDVQLDRDPETGDWVASRLQVRASYELARGLRLHGRYAIRRPYSIYRVQRVISYRRDQANAGVSVYTRGITVGGNVAFNFFEDEFQGRIDDGRTLSGYAQVPQVGLGGLSFMTTASYWQAGEDDEGSSFFFTTGVSRYLGQARVRVQYQFYRTVTLADPFVTHSGTLYAVVPLGRGFYTSSNVRLQRSTALRSVALYTSLWYTFR